MHLRFWNSSSSPARSAFTLTELLIVIGIIVLFVTLALPAFNLISGGKSIAGAENELGAMLGRVRMEAVGVQDYRGLAIFRDSASDRYGGAVVTFPVYSFWSSTTSYSKYAYVTELVGAAPSQVTHYYVSTIDGNYANNPTTPNGDWSECAPNTVDIEPNTDVQTFPAGIGMQVINNGTISVVGGVTTRQTNGYLPIGVILFDGSGVLAQKNLYFAESGNLGTSAHFSAYSGQTAGQTTIPYYNASSSPTQGLALTSSFGVVAFDKQTYDGQNFYSGLPTQLSSNATNGKNANYASSGEPSADGWLDANATPLLINRYNGTLIRSE